MEIKRGYKSAMSRIIAQHLENIDCDVLMRKLTPSFVAHPRTPMFSWGRK